MSKCVFSCPKIPCVKVKLYELEEPTCGFFGDRFQKNKLFLTMTESFRLWNQSLSFFWPHNCPALTKDCLILDILKWESLLSRTLGFGPWYELRADAALLLDKLSEKFCSISDSLLESDNWFSEIGENPMWVVFFDWATIWLSLETWKNCRSSVVIDILGLLQADVSSRLMSKLFWIKDFTS